MEETKTIPNIGRIVACLKDKNFKKALINIVSETERNSTFAIDYQEEEFIKETITGYEGIKKIAENYLEGNYSKEVVEVYNAADECLEWIKSFGNQKKENPLKKRVFIAGIFYTPKDLKEESAQLAKERLKDYNG